MNKIKLFFEKNTITCFVLALLPILFVANNLTNALGIGLGFSLILLLSVLINALLLKAVDNDNAKFVITLVVMAMVVSLVDLLMKAFMYDLSTRISLYVSMLLVNSIVFVKSKEAGKEKNIGKSLLDSLLFGVFFLLLVILIAFIRQVFGTGIISLSSLFSGKQLFATKQFIASDYLIPLLTQPAGGLILTGLLVAIISGISSSLKKQADKVVTEGEGK